MQTKHVPAFGWLRSEQCFCRSRQCISRHDDYGYGANGIKGCAHFMRLFGGIGSGVGKPRDDEAIH